MFVFRIVGFFCLLAYAVLLLNALLIGVYLQAISPELTFYSSSKDIGNSASLSNKLLYAELDAFSRLDFSWSIRHKSLIILVYMDLRKTIQSVDSMIRLKLIFVVALLGLIL